MDDRRLQFSSLPPCNCSSPIAAPEKNYQQATAADLLRHWPIMVVVVVDRWKPVFIVRNYTNERRRRRHNPQWLESKDIHEEAEEEE